MSEANNNLKPFKAYLKATVKDRRNYIDSLFGSEGEHKICVKVISIEEKRIAFQGKYFLCQNGIAKEFILFKNDRCNMIEIDCRELQKYDYVSGFDYANKNNICKGDLLVCDLIMEESSREIKKDNFFTTSIPSIDKNIDLWEKYTRDYGEMGLCLDVREGRDDNSELKTGLVIGYFCKELEAKTEEISSKKREIEDLDNKIKSLSAELSSKRQEGMEQIEQKLEESRQNLKDTIDREMAIENERLKEIRQEIEKQRGKLAFLEAFQVPVDTLIKQSSVDDEITGERYDIANFQEAIRYLQSYLHNNYQLDYSEDILRSIYLGLETGQLLLLVGRPGTGKTSLVRYLAKALGFADAAIIPVQSNWTDKGDLIGYYNSLEKTYVATHFLDKLLEFCQEACKNPEKLYFICLDEMNLAHVEHYFAEFLSVLQETDEDKRILRLYSSALREDIARELKVNALLDEDNQPTETYDKEKLNEYTVSERKYFLELCRQANMFVRYPATIKIPNNIKFFGTLNQDATTLDISPKVLDRAYVIRLENQDSPKSLETTDDATVLPLQYKSLREYESIVDDDYSKLLEGIIGKINAVVEGGLSRRVRSILESNNNCSEWENVMGRKDFEDCLVASFVLPRMRYEEREDYRFNERIGALERLCEELPVSKDIFNAILSKDKGELDFWRA